MNLNDDFGPWLDGAIEMMQAAKASSADIDTVTLVCMGDEDSFEFASITTVETEAKMIAILGMMTERVISGEWLRSRRKSERKKENQSDDDSS